MHISDILRFKYPLANYLTDIILRDDGDGVYISYWGLPDPCPTDSDLQQWQAEMDNASVFISNKSTNQVIYDQLDAIDLKSIRALRTNDTVILAALEAQAVTLRAQLLPVS